MISAQVSMLEKDRRAERNNLNDAVRERVTEL